MPEKRLSSATLKTPHDNNYVPDYTLAYKGHIFCAEQKSRRTREQKRAQQRSIVYLA